MASYLKKLNLKLYLGPLAACPFFFLIDLDMENPLLSRMAGLVIWMSIWWLTEAVPLAVTALLPFILFPALGIESGSNTAPFYINSTIFLFLGGFILALAMERWNLQRRIALYTVSLFGSGPRQVILGIMSASALLSMWISNTAAAVMMLPVGLSFLSDLEDEFGKERIQGAEKALLLGIAYSCSIGGIATLVGTPPNLILARVFSQEFPEAPPISFGQWFLLGFPLALILHFLIWFALTRIFFKIDPGMKRDEKNIQELIKKLGPPSYEEIWIMIFFSLLRCSGFFAQISRWAILP